MFKMQSGIIEPFSAGATREPEFNLRVNSKSQIQGVSYDSPLKEKMNEEENIRRFYTDTSKPFKSQVIGELSPTLRAAKLELYGQDLYNSNILVFFLFFCKKNLVNRTILALANKEPILLPLFCQTLLNQY